MFVFGFFCIALGFNRHYQKDWKQNKEEVPPAEEGGLFHNLWSRLFGDQQDKAALKEKRMWPQDREHGVVAKSPDELTDDLCLVIHEFLQAKFPEVNTAEQFSDVRNYVRALGGLECIRKYLSAKRLIKGEVYDHQGNFNAHARYGAGLIKKSSEGNRTIDPAKLFADDQRALGDFGKDFVLARNLFEADQGWENKKPDKTKLPSMSKRHRFLDIRDQEWKWFNVVAFGLSDKPSDLQKGIEILKAGEQAIFGTFLRDTRQEEDGWKKVEIAFHALGHNSVPSLHMHIIDTSQTGKSYDLQKHKNLLLKFVIQVLEDELKEYQIRLHEIENKTQSDD